MQTNLGKMIQFIVFLIIRIPFIPLAIGLPPIVIPLINEHRDVCPLIKNSILRPIDDEAFNTKYFSLTLHLLTHCLASLKRSAQLHA